MDAQIYEEMLTVITQEQQRRRADWERRKRNAEAKDLDADWYWHQYEAPVIRELCLLVLLAVRHEAERDLIFLAAAVDQGEIGERQLRENIDKIGKNWKEIKALLKYEDESGFKFFEVLRLLANCYKHDFAMEPDSDLLEYLLLPKEDSWKSYADLRYSDALWSALAGFVGLSSDADDCAIAKCFLERVSDFLSSVRERVRERVKLSPPPWGQTKFVK